MLQIYVNYYLHYIPFIVFNINDNKLQYYVNYLMVFIE